MPTDVSGTIVPRSDQLNAEDLLAGPIVITVTGVQLSGSSEQPVIVNFEGDGGKPYKPSKTQRKVLVLAWGPDADAWAGRSMQIWCDPEIKFGGEKVGGIRISHLTDIERDINVSLLSTKGKKAQHVIKRLDRPRPAPPASDAPDADTVQLAIERLTHLAETEGRDAYAAAWKAMAGPLKVAIGIPERDRIARLASAARTTDSTTAPEGGAL